MKAKKGYKLCKECGQPILKKGQTRKHIDDYRHAGGCPNDDRDWIYRMFCLVRELDAVSDGEKIPFVQAEILMGLRHIIQEVEA